MSMTDRAPARTRDEIVRLLKELGPTDSSSLAARLGVSAMAVRQHLYAMRERGLVDFATESRPRGRPAKLWRVTSGADAMFPDSHGELASSLIDAAREAFGEEGIERLMAARAAHQVDRYSASIPARASLRRRAQALARIRTEEGYMAEVLDGPAGSVLLAENHCPIGSAARSCAGLCGAELDVFRAVLGEDVSVERKEHIMSGARRCVYEIRASRS